MDTVREPLLVLDEDLRIVVASRSFYRRFEMTRPATQGHKIYDLDYGLWDIPELRLLLEKIVPEHEVGLVTGECKKIYLLLFCQDIGRFFSRSMAPHTFQIPLGDIRDSRRAFRYQALLLHEPGVSWRIVK